MTTQREWKTHGKCVFVGWEDANDGHEKRFIAKIEFDHPPEMPLSAAWGEVVVLKSIGAVNSLDEARELLREADNMIAGFREITRKWVTYQGDSKELDEEYLLPIDALRIRISAYLEKDPDHDTQ